MNIKKRKRPRLPTYQEFMKMQESEQVSTTDDNSLSINADEPEEQFLDPIDHYGFLTDTLEHTKIYDPYYPNIIN